MAIIDEKLVDNYINGEYIDEELIKKLENSVTFMKKVIKKSNDYKMYFYCSDKVKSDSSFIRFLMKNFINELDFLCNITDYYFERCKEDQNAIEIALLLRAILKKNEDERYMKYETISNLMYGGLRLQVEAEKRRRKDDYKFQADLGMGFWYVYDVHASNEPIIRYYAKKMLEEIFILPYYGLDRILHTQYSSVEELENKGVYSVLINVVSIYDSMLSMYVAVHKDLLKKAIQKFYTVIKRWDTYVDVNESNKYDDISTEVESYMDDKYYDSALSGEELLSLVGKQFGIQEKMIQYHLIDETDVKMLDEEEANYRFIINTSMMDRINYNHVKNIVKSALFPSQAHSEEEEPHECRVYKLDDYRARKQEKTRQN